MDTNKTYSVYMHIFPDGKRYVGMTSSEPVEKRWGPNGCRYQTQSVYDAILEQGWDNIAHVIVCQGIPFHDAELKERELIKRYKTTDPEHGYNISHGGMYGKGILNESTKEKLRQWDFEHPEAAERMRWYARHKSPETIEKIRQKATGVKQSEETKEKRAAKLRGRKQTSKAIERMCSAQSNRAWEEKRVRAVLSATEKPVLQYDISGSFIHRHESATKAALAVGGSFGSVARCCRKERHTYKGYIWRYE